MASGNINGADADRGGGVLTSLKGGVDRKQYPKAARAAWISKETWKLEDWRAAL